MAKYLQYHHGYKVLALVPPKEHGYIRELARSYGFTGLWEKTKGN